MSVSTGDHSEYVAFVRRAVRALARRVGGADPEDLAEMLGVAVELDEPVVSIVINRTPFGKIPLNIGNISGRSSA